MNNGIQTLVKAVQSGGVYYTIQKLTRKWDGYQRPSVTYLVERLFSSHKPEWMGSFATYLQAERKIKELTNG